MAKFLIISSVFYPDTASTAQHLYDLALELTKEGNEVTAITSRFSYENPSIKYSPFEIVNGIKIIRLNNTGFGKKTMAGRIADFFSYNFLLFFILFFSHKSRFDKAIGMTTPPLISFLGVFISKMKKWKFYYWSMDLQPELSIESGLMKKGSFTAKMFTWIGDYIFKRSNKIIALDRFMKEHIIERGAKESQVAVVPVWPVMESLYAGKRMDNPFRLANNFSDKMVVMFSGNHSYVHPLDTILECAKICKENENILFVFIGEGYRKKEVIKFKADNQLNNIISLPYQPRNNIHNSLGSSDFQLVIMGNGQVGYTHPNKIYGAMFIGKPFIYIGPKESHIGDIIKDCPQNISVEQGQAQQLAEKLIVASQSIGDLEKIGQQNRDYALRHFEPEMLKRLMVQQLN